MSLRFSSKLSRMYSFGSPAILSLFLSVLCILDLPSDGRFPFKFFAFVNLLVLPGKCICRRVMVALGFKTERMYTTIAAITHSRSIQDLISIPLHQLE